MNKSPFTRLILFVAFLFPSLVFAQGLEGMTSPISNPTKFEDPRINSELRFLYLFHEIDDEFATGGGDVQVYALQARYAVNDKFALIATKDGFVDFNPDGLLESGTGFANIGAGFKYAFHQEEDSIATFGLRYEIPLGESDVLQGEGNGVLNPFVTGAMELGPVNFMTQAGFRMPFASEDSTFFDFDMHFDYPMGAFTPVVEFNLINVIEGGNRLPIADEGQDFFNLGASGSTGESIVTAAAGGRYQVTDELQVGAAYQFPLDPDEGTRIIDWRINFDVIYSF